MHLRPLTNGKVSGTGTISLKNHGLTGVCLLVSTDGTNAAAVILRKGDASGDKILDASTKNPGTFPHYPVSIDGVSDLYYDITGTGASAQIYGYVA